MSSSHATRRRRRRHLMLIAVLFVLTAAGAFSLRVYRLRQSAIRLVSHVRRMSPSELLGADVDADSAADVQAVRLELESLDHELRAIRRATAWLAEPLAEQRWWPWLGQLAVLVDRGLDAAVDLTEAAWWTVLSVESDLHNHGRLNEAAGVPLTLEAEPLETALEALGKSRESLLRARDALEEVGGALPAIKAPLGSRYERVERYLGLAPMLLDGLAMVPLLAVPERETNLLLLIQNNEELRPTGGFISSVARVKLRGYRLADVTYMNSYDIEAYHGIHPPAPAPLQEHMQAGLLLFRDANWSPDFPTSAEVLAALYEMDMGERPDLIAAVDITFAQLLLRAVEPLPVPGYDVTLTADTLIETAIEFWERPLNAASIDERSVAFQDWLQHRKDFGAALLQAGLARMRRLTAADIERLALALREGAETKHLLVWALNDETLQSDLRRMRWDGGLEQVEGDYVMIVDANLGWNKADRYIERRFDYRVVLGEERPKAQLSLIYDNRSSVETSECVHAARYEDSYEALANQCYWNYVRVLVPRESALVRSEGNQGEVSVTLLGGYTAFGVFMVVPPGETRSVRLEYWLPSGIGATARRGHRYALWVQKQPGTLATRGIVHVTLASERDVVFTAPGWRQSGPREVSREEMISRDTQMALIWREAAR